MNDLNEKFMRDKKRAMIKVCFWFVMLVICGIVTFLSIIGNGFGLLSDIFLFPVPVGVMIWSMITIVMVYNVDKALAWPPPYMKEGLKGMDKARCTEGRPFKKIEIKHE